MKFRRILLAATSITAILAPAASHAQAVPDAAAKTAAAPSGDASDAGDAEILVTGSRIIRDGGNAPTPVTILGAEQLENGAPGTVADALAQVPQFRSSSRPGSFLNSQNSTGAFLNLRGLGQSRTLVLLDGRRTPPTTPEGRTDINTYPQLLTKRVDIVTGGASAAYGSDAVSGVVNFIVDTTFTGLKADVNYGISGYNDNQSVNMSLAFGRKFAGDRGHVVVSVDYSNSLGIDLGDNRAWTQQNINIIPNPTFATDGRTANLWRSGVTSAQLSEGGVIYAGPLRGTQFLPGGVTAPFVFGSEASGGTMIGGSGIWSPRQSFITPIKTLTTYGHVSFDVTPDFSTFVEASTSSTRSEFNATMPNWSGTTAFTIFNNNAYLPADIRTRLGTTPSFTMGRLSTDFGPPNASSDTKSWRVAGGFSYKFGSDWTIQGSVDSGRTRAILGNTNIVNQTKLFNAVDAVVNPANGQIVCRSELTAPNGCVPINLFGKGSPSQAALNYILGDAARSEATIQQTAGALSIRGQIGSTWAGPIRIGGGLDYRRITAEQDSDPFSSGLVQQFPGQRGLPASLVNKFGVFPVGNLFSLPRVQQVVKEVFVETLVPLANDSPIAGNMDLNAAYRYADYDTSGGVSSWKVGLTWQPIDAIRLRGTRSRDVRAPTLNDLYSPMTSSLGTLRDPVTGANNPIPGITVGNPNLVPELANTLTAGIVVQPAFIPGFSLSVDWYDIKVKGAIGNLNRLRIVEACAAGQTLYCQFVDRLPNGTLVSTTVSPQNLNSLRNRGVDVELNYRTGLSGVGIPGEVRLRGLVAYLANLTTVDAFGTTIEQAGVNGGEAAGTPHWQGSTSLTYTLNDFTLFVQERIIGSGIYSNNYVVGGRTSNSIDFNSVAGRAYTDITAKYKFKARGGQFEAYMTVNNLFDNDPPASPTRVGTPVSILGTNPTLYDIVGRYFTFGLRTTF